MPIIISDTIKSSIPGGTVIDDTQVDDTNPGKSNLHESLEHVEEPRMFNTFILSANGDDANDGSNFQNAIASVGRGMTLAAAVTPTTDHKTLLSFESRNFGDFINNTTIGNVANLVFEAKEAYFEDMDLTRQTTLWARRCIGNVIIGNKSHLIISGALGHDDAKTITFVAGQHVGTRLQIQELLGSVTLSFAGITTGSSLRVEIAELRIPSGSSFESVVNAILATIPSGVDVSGYIGKHNFGQSSSTPDYQPIKAISEVASPRTRRLMLGALNDNFLNNGQTDAANYDQVFALRLEGARIGYRITGELTIDKHISGVAFPAHYYYRVEGDGIVPTTDGTDTATSDVRDYVGSSRNMWYTATRRHAQIANSSRVHNITIPIENLGELIINRDQNDPLLVVFNFPSFNVNVQSFEGQMTVITNTGEDTATWDGKVRARFDKAATNRYSITLGTADAYDSSPLRISDIFKKSTHFLRLDESNQLNYVDVNGEVAIPVPHMANSVKLATIDFEVITEDPA